MNGAVRGERMGRTVRERMRTWERDEKNDDWRDRRSYSIFTLKFVDFLLQINYELLKLGNRKLCEREKD